MQQPAPRGSGLQTADRALRILLEFRVPGETLGVSELAGRLGLHRSTASRLVSTLEARGFLERVAGEGVQLGPEAARLGRVALAGRDMAAIARPVLEDLAERTGEAVTMAVASGGQVLTVAESAGRHFVSSRNWVGVRTPAHCTSDGKVLLAFGAIRTPAGPLARLTDRTIVDADVLGRELERVRERGLAVARGEVEHGLNGIAVPVFERGECVAALCISGPEYRLRGDFEASLAPACRTAAAWLERLLGPRPGASEAVAR